MKVRGPIGGPRQDAYALMLAAFASGPRKDPVSAAEFMPWAVPPRTPPTSDEIAARRRKRRQRRQGHGRAAGTAD